MSNPLEDGLDVVDGIWPEEWGVMEQIWPDFWTVVHDGEVIHESMDISDHPFLQQLARAYPPPPEEEREPIVEIQAVKTEPHTSNQPVSVSSKILFLLMQ